MLSLSVVPDSLWAQGLLPPVSSVQGILQARMLEGVAILFSTQGWNLGLSLSLCLSLSLYLSIKLINYIYKTLIYILVKQHFKVKLTQSCLTLCEPRECILPVSSVLGILQARILEGVGIFFLTRDWIRVSCISGRFFTVWATRDHYGFLNPVSIL